ncbi:histidine kinase [Streptomyces sp. NPDC051561]|uniref:sensor histidine kinase n=1 Tax=Streptomyces sp. NPDC051561 TaxID=3365658 RepID=UPI003792E199
MTTEGLPGTDTTTVPAPASATGPTLASATVRAPAPTTVPTPARATGRATQAVSGAHAATVPADTRRTARRLRGQAAFGRSFRLWLLSLRALPLSLWLSVVYVVLATPLGPRLLPGTVRRVRQLTDRQRELANDWSGEVIPAPYPELPSATPAEHGRALRAQLLDKRNQTWRDWRWAVLHPVIGGLIAFAPTAFLLSGVWGLFVAAFGVRLSESWDNVWYFFVPVGDPLTATLAGVLALAQFPFALRWTAPRVVHHHARYLRVMLAPPGNEQLAHRIDHLTATRSQALDTQMSEIRRIERDLHDGAQVRLVAMGMTLNAAERLLKTNPDAVPALLSEARESSNQALAELRNLVRGIHPPILADRGLPDAVRSLALLSPLDTQVTVDLPARPEPPVESAAYFAVSELLANAAKHSGATRVDLHLRHDPARGTLHLTVTDNGHGGADPAKGTGLQGIAHRLAAFDGGLTVTSPAGGPTLASLEIPCALSSPKTTSS